MGSAGCVIVAMSCFERYEGCPIEIRDEVAPGVTRYRRGMGARDRLAGE